MVYAGQNVTLKLDAMAQPVSAGEPLLVSPAVGRKTISHGIPRKGCWGGRCRRTSVPCLVNSAAAGEALLDLAGGDGRLDLDAQVVALDDGDIVEGHAIVERRVAKLGHGDLLGQGRVLAEETTAAGTGRTLGGIGIAARAAPHTHSHGLVRHLQHGALAGGQLRASVLGVDLDGRYEVGLVCGWPDGVWAVVLDRDGVGVNGGRGHKGTQSCDLCEEHF